MFAELWVSVDEIAKHLSVTEYPVYRWIENKDLSAHKVGYLWELKPSKVDEWVRIGSASANDGARNRGLAE